MRLKGGQLLLTIGASETAYAKATAVKAKRWQP